MKTAIVKLANLVGETGVYRFICPGRIPVFMLHRVVENVDDLPGAMSAQTLRSYLKYLSRHRYSVLSMDDLWEILAEGRAVPSRSVMFTIDDGFRDHHEVAASLFDEFGYSLNLFVITSLLDGKLWPWDDQIAYGVSRTTVRQADIQLPSGVTYLLDLEKHSIRHAARAIRNALKTHSQAHIYEWLDAEFYPGLRVSPPPDIPREFQPMSWDDARSLRARGHGVYPHTCSHRILSTLSVADKQKEILQSLARVSEELSYEPEVFAYPTGRPSDYDSTDVDMLRNAGVKMAFNTVPDYVRSGQGLYDLSRFSLPDNMADFLQIVNRFEALKARFNRQPEAALSFLPSR
ncbi:polysaccharide deacetylase family protein [Marinobacter sp.]|uniref:polysaccharide deacetylase family protein n=1 Tax=Marinobacter sp. TaxID=50741 RepID=UPI0034A40DF2